jgi:hypothetical protein
LLRREASVTATRLLAIGFIYCCTCVAWTVLGGSLVSRTGERDERLSREVALLWGGHHDQMAPEASIERPRTVTEHVEEKDATGKLVRRPVTKTVRDRVAIPLSSSRVQVDLRLDHRRKGLLWYDTYEVDLSARYTVRNPDRSARVLLVRLAFPSADAIYDGFVFRVNQHQPDQVGGPSSGDGQTQTTTVRVELEAHQEAVIEVAYQSRGLGDWIYSFGPPGVTQVRDFQLDMTTDFEDIDFPAGTLSPSTKQHKSQGYRLGWRFDSLVTGQRIGMDLPNRLNPGPLAARITFFAPVSLLFFVTVLVVLGVLRRASLHPMNYLFLAAAFFSFHLLLAYLVDHVDINLAFLLASVVSIGLVVSYLRLVLGLRVALAEAGAAQLVFLVLFSYAFFLEGYTGLTVTVGAVVTLFVLMQITGHVDWNDALRRRSQP